MTTFNLTVYRPNIGPTARALDYILHDKHTCKRLAKNLNEDIRTFENCLLTVKDIAKAENQLENEINPNQTKFPWETNKFWAIIPKLPFLFIQIPIILVRVASGLDGPVPFVYSPDALQYSAQDTNICKLLADKLHITKEIIKKAFIEAAQKGREELKEIGF